MRVRQNVDDVQVLANFAGFELRVGDRIGDVQAGMEQGAMSSGFLFFMDIFMKTHGQTYVVYASTPPLEPLKGDQQHAEHLLHEPTDQTKKIVQEQINLTCSLRQS